MPSLLCELALLLQTISNVPLDSLFTHTPLSSVHMFKVLHFLIPHRLEFLRMKRRSPKTKQVCGQSYQTRFCECFLGTQLFLKAWALLFANVFVPFVNLPFESSQEFVGQFMHRHVLVNN